jgi:hypothetical protein
MRFIKWASAAVAAGSLLFAGLAPASAHGGGYGDKPKEGEPCEIDGESGTWQKIREDKRFGKPIKVDGEWTKNKQCVPDLKDECEEPPLTHIPDCPEDEPEGEPEDEEPEEEPEPEDEEPEPEPAVAVVVEPVFTG